MATRMTLCKTPAIRDKDTPENIPCLLFAVNVKENRSSCHFPSASSLWVEFGCTGSHSRSWIAIPGRCPAICKVSWLLEQLRQVELDKCRCSQTLLMTATWSPSDFCYSKQRWGQGRRSSHGSSFCLSDGKGHLLLAYI